MNLLTLIEHLNLPKDKAYNTDDSLFDKWKIVEENQSNKQWREALSKIEVDGESVRAYRNCGNFVVNKLSLDERKRMSNA